MRCASTSGGAGELVAVHRGGADRSRAVKPSIPLLGDHAIPVHDEVELELRLR